MALTRWGMAAERLVAAFWPFWTVLALILGALLLGLGEALPLELLWPATVLAVLGTGITFWHGLRRMRWPKRAEAEARVDARLSGRPLAALRDQQAVGQGDPGSEALWRDHQARMAERAGAAAPVAPEIRTASADPFALRYIALLLLSAGLLFGSLHRLSLPGGGGGAPARAAASAPLWEGWAEPPAYTGLPVLYLADQPETLILPQGTEISLRLYGPLAALTVAETVSARTEALPSAAEPVQSFTVEQAGQIAVNGPHGRRWDVRLRPDLPPVVAQVGAAELTLDGEMTLPVSARDDYGLMRGTATIALDLERVDRRHGLRGAPEPRPALTLPLPFSATHQQRQFDGDVIENFSEHPWAHLPVILTFEVEDGARQTGQLSLPLDGLPARRFFDPLAAALIEQRRDLLWSRDNVVRVAQVLRAVSYRPDGLFDRDSDYLRLRALLRQLEAPGGVLPVEARDRVADGLWKLAVMLEDGTTLEDARARLERARARLAEAMKRGASEQEIARLMQELRDATDAYLSQLARETQRASDQDQAAPQLSEDALQMTQQDLDRMMDHIQQLMEEGRMEAARDAMEAYQELLESLRITEAPGAPGLRGPRRRAMDGMADTLREQQQLSDDAFQDYQDQYTPDATPRAESDDLSARQRVLRDEVERQRRDMPRAGTSGGDGATEALEGAGRAMREAEEALREGDLPRALERQSEAMEALREGMRALGGDPRRAAGEEGGDGAGEARPGADPLGRAAGRGGDTESAEGMLQGDDVYRRARDLLDEIRRRAGERHRPEQERSYLERLLKRF